MSRYCFNESIPAVLLNVHPEGISVLLSQEASLYTVKAIAILDNDGERILAKVNTL